MLCRAGIRPSRGPARKKTHSGYVPVHLEGEADLAWIAHALDQLGRLLRIAQDRQEHPSENGNPIGVYGEMPESFMFAYITINNITVSFKMLAAGMFFSIGAGFYALYNFIMLGSFFALFYQYNVLGKALKVVWIHGTIEMSVITIACCAGFILGNSFMFPYTYSRLESFKRGARDSVKIVFGLIPLFICDGFLESFVTRYTEMELWLSLTIILGSMAFLLWYFIYLPFKFKHLNYATTKN